MTQLVKYVDSKDLLDNKPFNDIIVDLQKELLKYSEYKDVKLELRHVEPDEYREDVQYISFYANEYEYFVTISYEDFVETEMMLTVTVELLSKNKTAWFDIHGIYYTWNDDESLSNISVDYSRLIAELSEELNKSWLFI